MIIINPYAFSSGSGASTAAYNAAVAAAAPLIWWRLDETTGTSAADSSGNGYTGTLQGGGTFASPGVAIPPSFAGVGRGVDFSATSFDRIQSADNASLVVGTSATGAWTIVLWVAGDSIANAYLANRQNDQAVIYNFTAGTVEFFAQGYSGADPRTGSGISLPTSETTPRMIVYRYNNGTWSGFKDGVQVFSVSRSFALGGTTQRWNVGAANASNGSGVKMWDFAVYSRALSDTEIGELYTAGSAS